MQNVKQLCFLLVLIVMGTLPMLADSPGPEDENIPPVAYNAVLSETVPAAGEELGASLVLRGTVVVPEWIEDFKLEECLADYSMILVIEAGDLPRVTVEEQSFEFTTTQPIDTQVGTWEVNFDLTSTDLSAFTEVGAVTVQPFLSEIDSDTDCFVSLYVEPITFTYAP